MKTCPSCGSNIPDDAAVCSFCNENLYSPGPGKALRKESQILTLVMGILAFLCFPFGIIALILWFVHRGKVKRGLVKSDGTATAGMVLGIIGTIVQISGFIFLIMFVMQFKGAVGATYLMQVHNAQQNYKSSNNSFATELSQLNEYGLEDIVEASRIFGYELELTSDGEEWHCIANPIGGEVSESMPYLYIDQGGVVRSSQTEDIGPDSPEYQIPGFHETKGQFRTK